MLWCQMGRNAVLFSPSKKHALSGQALVIGILSLRLGAGGLNLFDGLWIILLGGIEIFCEASKTVPGNHTQQYE